MKIRAEFGVAALCAYALAVVCILANRTVDAYAEYCCKQVALQKHKGRMAELHRYQLDNEDWVVVEAFDSYQLAPFVSACVREIAQLDDQYFIVRCLIESSTKELYYRWSISSCSDFTYERLGLWYSENSASDISDILESGIFCRPQCMGISLMIIGWIGFVFLGVLVYTRALNLTNRMKMTILILFCLVSLFYLSAVSARVVFFWNVQ